MGTTSRRNVADLQKDDGSILHLYQKLIRLQGNTGVSFR
jgi:hypothetical protein